MLCITAARSAKQRTGKFWTILLPFVSLSCAIVIASEICTLGIATNSIALVRRRRCESTVHVQQCIANAEEVVGMRMPLRHRIALRRVLLKKYLYSLV